MRPPLPRCERNPPRLAEEMSSVEVLLARCASPARARSLLTVRAAISFAISGARPLSSRLSSMCSYWRAPLGAPCLLWHCFLLSCAEGGSEVSLPPLDELLLSVPADLAQGDVSKAGVGELLHRGRHLFDRITAGDAIDDVVRPHEA